MARVRNFTDGRDINWGDMSNFIFHAGLVSAATLLCILSSAHCFFTPKVNEWSSGLVFMIFRTQGLSVEFNRLFSSTLVLLESQHSNFYFLKFFI